MRVSIWTMCLVGVLLVLVAGCSTQSPTGPSDATVGRDATSSIPGLSSPQSADSNGASTRFSALTTVRALQGPRPRPQTWVDEELFAGVVTPATFDPANGNFDELYTGGNGFKNGVPLISESKPGDQDYNGGRWHRNDLKSGVDPNKYAEADSVEVLDLNDFESTDNYFECPLLPQRGNN